MERYRPVESYRSVFNGQIDILSNPELIFSRGRNIGGQSIRDMVVHQLPLTATGWNTSGLTQKIVDAYYMNDGSNCPGMNSEYANVPEYNNIHRLDSRPRATVSLLLQRNISHLQLEFPYNMPIGNHASMLLLHITERIGI